MYCQRLALALGGFTQPTLAACEVIKETPGEIFLLRDRTEVVHYALAPKDRTRWQLWEFGWHANAILGCEGCPDSAIAGSYVWMNAVREGEGLPTADEQKGFVEWQGATWYALRPAGALQLHGEPFVADWSGLPTIARRFKIEPEGASPHDIVAIAINDGCVSMAFFACLKSDTPSLSEVLASMMEDVPVRRAVGPAPQPAPR